MRLLLITALYIFLLNTTAGQSGFSKWFEFNSAANFHNMVLKNDTLIIAGTSKDLSTNKWGALFVKMDTSGTLLDYKLHLDSTDGQFAFNQGYPFISTSDGGYLMVGDVFNRENFFIYKLDENGDIEFFKEYEKPPDFFTILPKQVIEVEDGYLVINTAQLLNYSFDAQIIKINFEGEIIWEQYYGEYDKLEIPGSIVKEDDNTIVVGCVKETDQLVSSLSTIKCGSNWIFAIDSLGNIKWEWESEPCAGNTLIGLHRTADGGWIYATRKLKVFNLWNWGAAPKIVKRDSQFNLLWERQLAESYWDSNEMIDLIQTPDGNWVGAGRWVLPEPYNPLLSGGFYTSGCLYKVNEQGDSIWSRCDTVALDNPTSSYRYGGLVRLPSGSIVAAGGFREDIFGVGSKSWAWVTKVDRDGCMEDPCLLSSVDEKPLDAEMGLSQIYPNPTTGNIGIEAKSNIININVLNMNGQLLNSWKTYSTKKTIDISPLVDGVYFLEIEFKDKKELQRIVKMR